VVGGDSALDEALYLAAVASQVTVIHRRDRLRATRVLQERAQAHPQIAFGWHTVVEAIEGGAQVERLRLREVQSGETSALPVAGVFIYVGLQPNTQFLAGVVPLDSGGHVIVDQRLETAIPGLYAAGDLRQHSAHQLVASAGDGATAACFATQYVRRLRERPHGRRGGGGSTGVGHELAGLAAATGTAQLPPGLRRAPIGQSRAGDEPVPACANAFPKFRPSCGGQAAWQCRGRNGNR
jgi:NAD(P)H-nitrite reductase large subunit